MGIRHCPVSHCGPECHAAESTKQKRCYLLKLTMGCPACIGSYLAPLGEGELLNLHGDPIVLLDLLKCTGPGPDMEQAPLKEGGRWGTWPGISHH